MKIDRTEVAIGVGVLGASALIYWHLHPRTPAPATPLDTTFDTAARAANSSDAMAPQVSGGGYGTGAPDMGYNTAAVATTPSDTSPVAVMNDPGELNYQGPTGPDSGILPQPVFDTSPVAAPPPSADPVMPPEFSPGFVPIFGSPLWAFASKGYRLIGPGANSNGSYNTWEFWYPGGLTRKGNFYTSGSKKGTWVGPF